MAKFEILNRQLLLAIGATVGGGRRARRWPQRRLAAEAGITQSMISDIEHARLPDLPLRTAIRVLTVLEVEVELDLRAPRATAPPQRDRAHAWRVAYVARRMERTGWRVVTEAPVGGRRWLGFVDILAYHPVERVLLVIEVKTEIHDVGEIERQLGSYERGVGSRGGPGLAATHGHRMSAPARDRRERSPSGRESAPLRPRLPGQGATHGRTRRWTGGAAGPKRAWPRDDRPWSRRRAWILPTWLDGRRTPARYSDRPDYLGRR